MRAAQTVRRLLSPDRRRRGTEINRHEMKRYSQNGEDGILLYLFSHVGTDARTVLEMACGDGAECMAANLALSFGWGGLLIEGDPEKAASAQRLYAGRPDVEVRQQWLTTETLPDLADVDLLSIDVDGNDYWLWAEMPARPRVVVIEYNASFGPERSVTIPYDPTFDRKERHRSGWYHGASLTALAALGDRLGYALVGCDSRGVNAFFVRRDVQGDVATVDPAAAWFPHASRTSWRTTAQQWETICHLPLVEV